MVGIARSTTPSPDYFYFPEVDHEAHKYGPDAKETQDAVHLVDESIGRMVAVIDSSFARELHFRFRPRHDRD